MCKNKSSFVLSIYFTIFGNGMAQSSSIIRFHHLTPFGLKERKRLKKFILSIFRREKHDLYELSYIFCDDPYLLNLNREFLDHSYYTDILTFPLSDPASKKISGEIYISVDRVRENALEQKTTFREEMHRVIFHGALHLCHYKDKSKKEQAVMRAKENYYLDLYFK